MRPLRIGLGVAFVLSAALVKAVPASAVMTDGALVFTSTADGADGDVFAQNADGSGVVQLTRNGSFEADAAWAPDGSQIAFTRKITNVTCPSLGCMEVFVMNADGTGATRLTQAPSDGQDNRAPAWSPDGSWLAYNTTQYGAKDIMKIAVSGGVPVRLTTDAAHDYAPTWAPDGSSIAFVSQRTGSARLFTMDAGGSGQIELVLNGPDVPNALIGDPDYAPDGTRLAFRGAVDQWSETSIYVTGADGTGSVRVWTTPDTKSWVAYDPSWAPAGDALAFSVDTFSASGFDLGLVDVASSVWTWAQRGVGDEVNPDWTSGSAPVVPPPPSGASVAVTSYAFSPSSPTIQLGQSVTWEFASQHTATDRTGLGLYDSGTQGSGDNYVYPFTGAGTFSFNCTLHPRKMTGSVNVPVSLDPTAGGTGTSFTVRWASAGPPTGALFDVMVLRPGAKRWASWKSDVTTRTASFVPDAGAGTYRFKARVRLSSKKVSGYSPAASLSVT